MGFWTDKVCTLLQRFDGKFKLPPFINSGNVDFYLVIQLKVGEEEKGAEGSKMFSNRGFDI